MRRKPFSETLPRVVLQGGAGIHEGVRAAYEAPAAGTDGRISSGQSCILIQPRYMVS